MRSESATADSNRQCRFDSADRSAVCLARNSLRGSTARCSVRTMCAVQEEEYTLATASQSADFAVQVLTLRKNFRQFQVRTPVGAAVGYPAYVDGCRHKTVPFAIASHQPETLRDAIPPHCATAAAQTRIFTLFVSAWADGRRRAARAAVTSARAASRSQETPSSKPSRCEAQVTSPLRSPTM